MSIRKLSNSSYHGQGGPLKLSAANHISAIGPAFVASGRHLGYCIGDYNGEKPNVFSLSQTTTRRGARQSAAKSYLDPIAYRSNLKVLTYATARKITFDSSLRADSVIFNRLLSDHKVFARKEIILSAGALQSPKLLMQSGIGPRDHLDDLKIHVVNDLAGVGQNLQDHPTVGGMVFLINASVSLSDKRASSPLSVADYLTSGSGPLSSTIIEATGFINRKLGPSHPWPSVQLILMSSSFLSSQEGFLFRRVYGLTAELWSHYEPYFGRDSFMIFPVLLRPRSRGTVKLNSWNWRDSPRVDVNFYSDPEDLEDIVDAMEFVLELTKAPPLARLNPTWLNISMPGCEEFMAPSREYLRCTARAMTLTFWHFSGTCKMGSSSDKMAVVDPDLQVIGVKGLRVVDASVMPNIVSGQHSGHCVHDRRESGRQDQRSPTRTFRPS
ncbi:Glucose dehydrogenase -like protein [Halotydeus destructor]|nr:Glucose dehydrogenase -like protein [Halotydeus destructor]